MKKQKEQYTVTGSINLVYAGSDRLRSDTLQQIVALAEKGVNSWFGGEDGGAKIKPTSWLGSETVHLKLPFKVSLSQARAFGVYVNKVAKEIGKELTIDERLMLPRLHVRIDIVRSDIIVTMA